MRTLIATAAATLMLAAAPAWAQDAAITTSSSNHGTPPAVTTTRGPVVAPNLSANPVTGVGVSVESSPGGLITNYSGPAVAETACTGAGGTYRNTAGKLTCLNAKTPLPQEAAITSSASNIKSPPGIRGAGGAAGPLPQEAAISASSSNIKSPPPASRPSAGTTQPQPQDAAISASMNNVKSPPPGIRGTGGATGPQPQQAAIITSSSNHGTPPNLTGNPVTGVGVSVESSPGGIITQHSDASSAQAACVAAGGTFQNAGGKRSCLNPTSPVVGATPAPAGATRVRDPATPKSGGQ